MEGTLMAIYIYSISNDTKEGQMNASELHQEIDCSLLQFQGVQINQDILKILFAIDLSPSDKSILDSIIANHSGINDDSIIVNNDYYKTRNELRIQYQTIGWENLTDNEKEISAKYCLFDSTTIITFYISQGLSLENAITKYLVRRSIDIDKAAKCCAIRANSKYIKYISIKYMEEADAATFLDAIRNYIVDYSMSAHLGIQYGDSREGVMDYIEATNAYVGAGLSTYAFRSPYTYGQCRDELINYLVYGNEPEEFKLFGF